MRCLPRIIRNTLLIGALLLASRALTSCGTTCFGGVINNGTGTVLVQSSTPPPACPFSTGMSTMNIAVTKARICETCTASRQAQHIYVTLKSIQLHSVFPESQNNPEWLELAPQLLREPRQIDLLGDVTPERLVQSADFPAGTYGDLVLQFLPDTEAPAVSNMLSGENACGQSQANCMLMADGHVEQLHFTSNASQLRLPLQYNGSSALAVVPDGIVDLRLTLQPKQVSVVSPLHGWQIHYVLEGTVTASR